MEFMDQVEQEFSKLVESVGGQRESIAQIDIFEPPFQTSVSPPNLRQTDQGSSKGENDEGMMDDSQLQAIERQLDSLTAMIQRGESIGLSHLDQPNRLNSPSSSNLGNLMVPLKAPDFDEKSEKDRNSVSSHSGNGNSWRGSQDELDQSRESPLWTEGRNEMDWNSWRNPNDRTDKVETWLNDNELENQSMESWSPKVRVNRNRIENKREINKSKIGQGLSRSQLRSSLSQSESDASKHTDTDTHEKQDRLTSNLRGPHLDQLNERNSMRSSMDAFSFRNAKAPLQQNEAKDHRYNDAREIHRHGTRELENLEEWRETQDEVVSHEKDETLSFSPSGRDYLEDSVDDDWNSINRRLQANGFSPISLLMKLSNDTQIISPDQKQVRQVIIDLLSKYVKRGEVIQDIVLQSGAGDERFERQSSAMHAMKIELDHTRKSLKIAEESARQQKVELEELRKTHKDKVQQLNNKVTKLAQQLSQSEHRVKAKESIIQKMQEKLESEVKKDKQQREKDKNLFREIHNRVPRSTSTQDSKNMEFIRMFEREREEMTDEIHHLQQEVRNLSNQLREKENIIQLKDKADSWRTPQQGELLMTVERAKEEYKSRMSQLQQREINLIKKANDAEKRVNELEIKLTEVEEENTNLNMELNSRPSAKDWKSAQRKIQHLEKKLWSSEGARREAEDTADWRIHLSTRELIRRDKSNHKLGLHRISRLPKDVMVDLLQEICRELELDDFSLIISSIQRLRAVVTSLPRMEQFIRAVCHLVLSIKTDPKADSISNPQSISAEESARVLEDVIPMLKKWRQDILECSELKTFLTSLVQVLNTRSHFPAISIMDKQAILSSVEQLVELENRISAQQHSYQETEHYIRTSPDVIVHKIIRHFQHLFSVEKLAGVLPKINEIYLFVNEIQTIIRSLRVCLQLDSHASASHVLQTAQDRLIQAREIIDDPKATSPIWIPSKGFTMNDQFELHRSQDQK